MSAADLRGRSVEAVLPELAGVAGRGAGEWEISRTVATDLSTTQQVSRQTADGRQQTIACRVAPLRDQDGREGRLLVLRDMPPSAIKAPARTKNGIASSENLFTPLLS